jgi:hypothetical protein
LPIHPSFSGARPPAKRTASSKPRESTQVPRDFQQGVNEPEGVVKALGAGWRVVDDELAFIAGQRSTM